jgi:hypothetical protein
MMEIKTNVFQNAECRVMFAIAPESYRRGLLGWLIRERGLFVGDKKHDGSFTRSMLRKKVSGASGATWDRRIAKTFKGYIDNEMSLAGMSLKMGVNLRNPKPFAQSIAKMEEGYTESTTKPMIVPILDNQQLRRPRKLMLREFKELRARNMVYTVERAGRLYYIDRDTREALFVAVKSIKVPKQFDFIKSWAFRIPAALVRGQKAVDKQTEKIAKGGI